MRDIQISGARTNNNALHDWIKTIADLISQWEAAGQVERRWIDRTRQFLARGAG